MSIPGFEWPGSGVGYLRSEMQSELRQKADSHEVHSLNSKVDRLEHSLREFSSAIDGLRSELQTAQDKISQLEQQIIVIQEPLS